VHAQLTECIRDEAARERSAAGADGEAVGLRLRLDAADLALAAAQRAHGEALERAAAAVAEHRRQLLAVRDDAAAQEAAHWRERLAGAEAAARGAQAQAAGLADELARTRARAGGRWTPAAEEFAALERRVAEIEAEARAKEAQWAALLADSQGVHAAQAELLRQRWQLSLEAKDAEVGRFRGELDGLLAAARAVQAQQRRAQAEQQRQQQQLA
jgi:hypothetical protein